MYYSKHGVHTICLILWKLFPWKLKACSNRTLSSTVHSSGNGVKFGRSARAFSTVCLCQNNIPRACNSHQLSRCELHSLYIDTDFCASFLKRMLCHIFILGLKYCIWMDSLTTVITQNDLQSRQGNVRSQIFCLQTQWHF